MAERPPGCDLVSGRNLRTSSLRMGFTGAACAETMPEYVRGDAMGVPPQFGGLQVNEQ
jgi:hypothetical protein